MAAFLLLSLLSLLSLSLPSVWAQTSVLNLCYTASSYPNSVYGPWTIVVSGTFTVNSTAVVPSLSLAPVSAGGGRPAYAILSASATYVQTNRDGSVSRANLVRCVTGVQGSDNYVYQTAPYTDWNGFCLQTVNSSTTDLPAGQAGWLVYPNGFPSQQVEIYHNLPSESYPNVYHSDNPFNPTLTVSTSALTCTAPSTGPQSAPATTRYQFCYQAYGTLPASSTPWSTSIGGALVAVATPALTFASALGVTPATYGQYVLSVTGTLLQSNNSVTATPNPIVGVSWINPGGEDGNDANPDPFLLATRPHLSGNQACTGGGFSCFGGLILYAANLYFLPNGKEDIDSGYALVNAIYLRPINGSIIEGDGPTPTFSQFAVSPLAAGAQAAACPLITASSAAVTTDVSPLFSTAAQQAATTFNISFSYNINSYGWNLTSSTPLSRNGYWTVQVVGTLTVQAVTTAPYTGAANGTGYTGVYQVVGASGQRVYTDATGAKTVSTITGIVAPGFVYTAGSSLSSPFSNNNLVYTKPVNATGLGYNVWTVDASGLAFTIAAPASAPLGNPGMAGFPYTARFNQLLYIQVLSNAASGMREKGYGPILIDEGLTPITAPSSFTSEFGLQYTAYATSLGVQFFPGTNPLPNSLVPATTAYLTMGMCYIITPDETVQNGMWTIAASALLYVSPQLYTFSFGFTNGSGSAIRQGRIMYAMSQFTRNYIDEFGNQHISNGAVLQGPGGDGGSSNFLYTSILDGDREGLTVDGGGFTYTLLDEGAVTPGDPTLAVGLNVYSEFNYREAAEPWHQDGEYGGAGTVFTLTPGATAAPSCVAAPFTAVPNTGAATLQFAFCYAIQGTAGWSVTALGVFTTSATAFTSFNSANSLFYYIGSGISGTRTYVPSAGATAQVSTIIGLPGPGGDGQYDQKLYYNTSYKLGSGGWGYYVSPAAQVYGVAGTSTTVGIGNHGSGAAGPWLEEGFPQLNGTAASSVSASNFYFQPYLGATYSTCSPTTATIANTGTATLCFIMYSLPGNVDYPWSVATTVTFTYSSVTNTTAYGTAVQVLSGTGVRVFTNRFGAVTRTPLTVAPVGTIGSNNLLYLGSAIPVDSRGITWNFTTGGIQLPGHGSGVLYTTVNIYNTSTGVVVEGGSSRIDALGSAFLATVQGFTNTTIGASNINSLAANYGQCLAPLTFTNGLRAPTQPSASNGAARILFTYYVSDGATYSITGNLTITTTSAFASTADLLGNPYQTVTNVTGTRTYVYIPAGQTLVSTVSGVTTGSYAFANQRWFPYSLLASAPGVYSMNTAPFIDYDGVEFGINPPAPRAGMALGNGTLYNATSIYITASVQTAVLTDGYYTNLPLASLQQQTYTLLQ